MFIEAEITNNSDKSLRAEDSPLLSSSRLENFVLIISLVLNVILLVYPATLFYVPPLSQRLCDRLVHLSFAVPENAESIQFLELILNLSLATDQ